MMLPICKRYQMSLAEEIKYAWRRLRKPARVRIGGVLLRTDRPHISTSLRRLMYRGIYEVAEMKIVQAHLEPDDVVLEVGAGLGAVAALCAKRLGDGSRVHSFEANPEMETAIRETFEENGVVPNLRIGLVSDRDGREEFFIGSAFFSSSSICRAGNARRIEVPSFDLRRLIHEIRPTFLIVDAEGHELVLFNELDLSTVSKVCLELHPDIVGDAACSVVLSKILAQGFAAIFDQCEGRVVYLERVPGLCNDDRRLHMPSADTSFGTSCGEGAEGKSEGAPADVWAKQKTAACRVSGYDGCA